MKLTREQVQAKKDKAVRFVSDVLDDPDRADEIDDEDLEDYAARKKIELVNSRRNAMPGGNGDPRTKRELLDTIDDLQQENQDLRDQLDAIADIVAPPEEGEEEEEADDDDDE